MRYLCAALVLAASPCFAGPVAVWKGDGVQVLAYTDKCEVAELASVLSQVAPDARKAAVKFQGRELAACYVVQGDKLIIVDETGDAGYIEVKDFSEAKGV